MRILPAAGPERQRALGLLVVLAAVLAWFAWPGSSDSSPTPIPAPAIATTTAAATTGTGLPDAVRLDQLSPDRPDAAPRRNLFGYGTRPAPPPPPPRPTVAANPGPAVNATPPGPPPVPLALTGLTTMPGEQRVATLRDRDSGAVFQAVEGQVVDGRYRLVKLGLQSAIVSYLDGSGQRTLPLGGR